MSTNDSNYSLLPKAGFVAIEPPKFERIASRVNSSGIAMNVSRSELRAYKLVMNFVSSKGVHYFASSDLVAVTDDAIQSAWAKKVYTLNGIDFVLAPESEIQAYLKCDKF